MTATWDRFIQPSRSTLPQMLGPLFSQAQSGIVQTRATQQVGRTWRETYPPIKIAADLNARALLAQCANFYRNGTRFLIDCKAFRYLLGSGGGTPVVAGANQTGSEIATSGWTPLADVLKIGDVLTFAGLPLVYDVVQNIITDGSGNTGIAINPPIFAGGSPANGAAITINSTSGTAANVLFTCVVKSYNPPVAGPDEFYTGFEITFEESVG